jgi:hypothetical protein
MNRMLAILVGVGLAGCAPVAPVGPSQSDSTVSPIATSSATPSATPQQRITMATCAGGPFPVEVLEGVGPPPGDDVAADVLRRHIELGRAEDGDWIEALRTDDTVLFILPDKDAAFDPVLGEYPTHPHALVEKTEGKWRLGDLGRCEPWPALDPGVGRAVFRVAPDVELAADSTETAVLVTELACTRGQDARGRILPPQIFSDADSVTVVMTIRALTGVHTCIDGRATPFVLRLPEPLGERPLLDGYSIPPRDATIGSGY